MNILRFFRRPKKLVLIRRFSSRVTLKEWRTSSELVAQARKFLTDPEFLAMVDVLKNENPSNWMLDANVPVEVRAIMQARIEGYTLALTNLERLATQQSNPEELEPTYEDPPEEEAPFSR